MGTFHCGRLVARALRERGVKQIFTLCGFHIQAIYDGCIDEGIKIIDMRHEQAAVHAADAWARITGEPGVAVVTAGPGVTDAVTGIANAHSAESPVLVIAGKAPLAQADMGGLQEMEQLPLVRSITNWARCVYEPHRAREYVHRAFRKALAPKTGPVFLEIPADIISAGVEAPAVGGELEVPVYPGGRVAPEVVAEAYELISSARRPVVVAGGELFWAKAWTELADFLERFRIPAFLNGLGRGTLPADFPLYNPLARREMLEGADLLLVVGATFDFRLAYGRPPRIREDLKILQIAGDASEIGRNRRPHMGISGDIKSILKQFMAFELSSHDFGKREAWAGEIREIEISRKKELRSPKYAEISPIHPHALFNDLLSVADRDAVFIGDGGDFVAGAAKYLYADRPGHWLDPGPLGCLGIGVPFAVAAKLAKPEKQVFIIHGDGSFGFNAMEFDTAVRHDLPMVSIVGNDASWYQVAGGQIAAYGKERCVGSELRHTRYDLMVAAMGGHGEYVEELADFRPALERALASGKPACVNVKIKTGWGRKAETKLV